MDGNSADASGYLLDGCIWQSKLSSAAIKYCGTVFLISMNFNAKRFLRGDVVEYLHLVIRCQPAIQIKSFSSTGDSSRHSVDQARLRKSDRLPQLSPSAQCPDARGHIFSIENDVFHQKVEARKTDCTERRASFLTMKSGQMFLELLARWWIPSVLRKSSSRRPIGANGLGMSKGRICQVWKWNPYPH